MRTRIIAAFPGCGKSHFARSREGVLDSDSSLFSWAAIDGQKVRNPDFPGNYIRHIQENIGKVPFILVSTHKEVRDALLANCLFFYLVHPRESEKEVYLNRYRERGSSPEFVDLLDRNWEAWLGQLRFCEVGCRRISMLFPHLSDEIRYIIASENGEY